MPRARLLWKVVLGICAVLVLAAIGLAAYTAHVMNAMFETRAERLRTALASHRQAFLYDQRALGNLPLLAPRAGNRDAGPLIGSRVRWRLADGSSGPATAASSTLDPGILGTLGGDWIHAGPDVWGGIDFGWMAKLAEHDYWDVDRNGLPPGPGPFSDPAPDSSDLWAWSKLRIAKGVHEHALPRALSEVQDLARLCLSAERFQIQLAGLAMLRQLRAAVEREEPALSNQLVVTAETEDQMLRALSAARGFARLDTPASYEGDLAQVVLGRCTALDDGLRTALLVRRKLRDSRGADYQRQERQLAASPDCRLGSVRRRWAIPDDDRDSEAKHWWDVVLARRNGEVLLSIAEQEWFEQYEKRAP